MSLTEPCMNTGCPGTADPYGRTLGYCPDCFDERIAEDADTDHYVLTRLGAAMVDVIRTVPPKGGCAAWVHNPERWQPQQEQAA